MQIGKGKLLINEYALSEIKGDQVIGYIEPACDDPQWILWFTSKGDALLYTSRAPADPKRGVVGGAVLGDPIRISARKSAATQITHRTQGVRVITQKLEKDGNYSHNQ